MRTAALSQSQYKTRSDFCDAGHHQTSSSNALCKTAASISKAVEMALESTGKSAGCLAEWALRVCDDEKYVSFWFVICCGTFSPYRMLCPASLFSRSRNRA
jgi:hypothetical protein